jgi:hypothetical protein
MSISEKNLTLGQEAIDSLEQSLSTLTRIMLAAGQCTPIFVRRVPFRGTAEVSGEIFLSNPSSDDEAMLWATSGLTNTRWESRQHPKETLRCPGVVLASEKVLAAAKEANEAKASFKRVVDNIPKRERTELYRSVNRFSSLQALRLIEIIDSATNITLRWNYTHSTDRKECLSLKKELLASLSSHMGMTITEGMLTTQTHSGEMFKVAKDFECLSNIPDKEILAVVRPVQRHVRAYISPNKKLVNGRMGGRGYYVQANTPILIAENVSVTTEELTDHTGIDGTVQGVSPSFEENPIVERLSLYRYVESKRIFELPAKNNNSRMKGGNYLEVNSENET